MSTALHRDREERRRNRAVARVGKRRLRATLLQRRQETEQQRAVQDLDLAFNRQSEPHAWDARVLHDDGCPKLAGTAICSPKCSAPMTPCRDLAGLTFHRGK